MRLATPRRTGPGCSLAAAAAVVLLTSPIAIAQIDPVPRRLLHAGYNQPLEGKSPLSLYAFYLHNQTNFLRPDWTLRAAVAPVWLESELGWLRLLGPQTDVGIIVAGGGFARTYNEIRLGKWEREETFTGHGFTLGGALYHRFNPDQQVPLSGVLKLTAEGSFYVRDDETHDDFELPPDHLSPVVRAGLRLGGQEPDLRSPLALEASLWYEGRWRPSHGDYGFDNDRTLEEFTHRAWARLLGRYTTPDSRHDINISLTGGLGMNMDRLNAYRMGGVLPFADEFPLSIPGFFYQELSARNFILLSGTYSFAFARNSPWRGTLFGATSSVSHVSGLETSERSNSGIGGGVTWRSPRRDWIISAFYGYGFDAIRDGDRGGHMLGIILQYDFLLEGGWERFLAPSQLSHDVFRVFGR